MPRSSSNNRGDTDTPKDDSERKIRLYEEQKYVTGRIGETSRYIGFGVMAIFYTLITDDGPYAQSVIGSRSYELYIAAISGAATICFDYFQYLAGAWSVTKAIERKDRPFLYNPHWWSYRLRALFYWLKQAAALVAAVIILYIVASTSGG